MSITICDDHDFQCPICLQYFETEEAIVKMKCCGKFIHKSCLNEWRKQDKMKKSHNCVLCRSPFNGEEFENLPIFYVKEGPIFNETNINITININTNDQTNDQTRENKSFIGEIMEYLKVDSCFMSRN